MGWFIVSILIPLIAPILGMLVLQRLPLPVNNSQKHILIPIKDGQPCWASVAFCALAMYEIAVPSAEGPLASGNTVHWLNGGFVLLLATSAVIAAGGGISHKNQTSQTEQLAQTLPGACYVAGPDVSVGPRLQRGTLWRTNGVLK